jgi:DNA-binding response OmpR family regulator
MKERTANILSVGLAGGFTALDKLPARHLRASCGTEATQLMRAFEPDLVLLKWHLTDMPGEMLLKRVLVTKPTASVIAIVEAGNMDQEINARRAGATAVVDEAIDDKLFCEIAIQLCLCNTAIAD